MKIMRIFLSIFATVILAGSASAQFGVSGYPTPEIAIANFHPDTLPAQTHLSPLPIITAMGPRVTWAIISTPPQSCDNSGCVPLVGEPDPVVRFDGGPTGCNGGLGPWLIKSFAEYPEAEAFFLGLPPHEMDGLFPQQRVTADIRRAPGNQLPQNRWVVSYQGFSAFCF